MGKGKFETVKCRVLFFKETMGLQIGTGEKDVFLTEKKCDC